MCYATHFLFLPKNLLPRWWPKVFSQFKLVAVNVKKQNALKIGIFLVIAKNVKILKKKSKIL